MATHCRTARRRPPRCRAWAQWRNEAFGISYEPVVMVYNTRALPSAKVPHTRRQLLDRLRAEGAAARQGRHL
jgi:iron(III) transport system substrate-binding protein